MRSSLLLVVSLVGLLCGRADAAVPPYDPAAPGAPAQSPATAPATRPTALPSAVLPDGLGVNIHFTDPRPGEMKMLADGGFTWVRMDFAWGGTEHAKGEYDFAAYDRLLAALDEHKIKAQFILDYSNRLYDDGLSPHTDEGRAAFANWAAAAAIHFKGRGVLWEMYNEPNIHFWKPRPNVDDYVKLALAVGKALKDAAPDETYIGPATSEVDLPFIEKCLQGGLLEFWSAVSVHPYRQRAPETASDDYRKLRQLIRRYAPAGKQVPILSGEWGFSTGWKDFDEERQGKYLARQWLTNLYNEVPVSIWYDWHDDGADPKEAEHHFGTVKNEYHKDRDPVYDAKPSYQAAQALTAALKGYRYNKRIAVGDVNSDFVLLFTKGDQSPAEVKDVKLAVWTTSKEPRSLVIPAAPGSFKVVDHLGKPAGDLSADDKGLMIAATDAPQYITPDQPNDLLRLAAAAERAPLDTVIAGGRVTWVSLEMRNPLAEPIRAIGSTTGLFEPHLFPIPPGGRESIPCRAYLDRTADPHPMTVQIEVREMTVINQWTHVIVTNPMRVTPMAAIGKALPVLVDNPAGDEFEGTLFLSEVEGGRAAPMRKVTFEQGETAKVIQVPFDRDPAAGGAYRFALRVDDRDHNIAIKSPAARYRPIDDFARFAGKPVLADAYKIVAEGDAKVASEQTLAANTNSEIAPAPGVGTLEVKYRFDPGHKFIQVMPQGDALRTIEGKPTAMGLWVYGDGENNLLRMRFIDSTSQVFQRDAGQIGWKGWRYVTFPIESSDSGSHWAGANDGAVHFPIKLDTLFLLDSGGQRKTEGTIYLAAPVVMY